MLLGSLKRDRSEDSSGHYHADCTGCKHIQGRNDFRSGPETESVVFIRRLMRLRGRLLAVILSTLRFPLILIQRVLAENVGDRSDGFLQRRPYRFVAIRIYMAFFVCFDFVVYLIVVVENRAGIIHLRYSFGE